MKEIGGSRRLDGGGKSAKVLVAQVVAELAEDENLGEQVLDKGVRVIGRKMGGD